MELKGYSFEINEALIQINLIDKDIAPCYSSQCMLNNETLRK